MRRQCCFLNFMTNCSVFLLFCLFCMCTFVFCASFAFVRWISAFLHFSFVHCCICAMRWFCIFEVDLCIFHLCIIVFVLCVGFAFVWWIACGRNQSGNHGCNSHNALKSKKLNGDPADCWQVRRKH